MPFKPVRKQKVAEQIAESIREAILGGSFDPGQSLPSERDLAEQFAVNRSSVREAMLRLEAQGLVEVRHGGGTRVTDFLTTAGLSILPFLIAPGGRLDPEMVRDLMDLRRTLLGFTAARAATRTSPVQADELGRLVDAIDASTEPQAIQELDFAFFEALVTLSGNRVLGLLVNGIKRVYDGNRALFAGLYVGGFDTEPHRRTIAALRSGDAQAAQVAMEDYGAAALGGVA